MTLDATAHLVAMAHLCEAPVLAGNALVFGFDGQLVHGSGVVQARSGLRNGVQIDGLDSASRRKNGSGPGGSDGGAGWFRLLGPTDLLVMQITRQSHLQPAGRAWLASSPG